MAKATNTPQVVPTAPRAWRRLALGFGIVNIEVGISPAAGEDKATKIEGHKYDPVLLCRVAQRWESLGSGQLVEPVTGYEADNGTIVTFDEGELNALKGESDKAIALEGFVPVDDIDPVYFEKGYNIWPANHSQARAFAALAEALRGDPDDPRSARAGVGTTFLTSSTRVFVIKWNEKIGGLMAHICHFDSAIRWDALAHAVGFAASGPQPTKPEVAMARQLVEGLTTDFDQVVASVQNDYQAALAQAIAAKSRGAAEVEEVEETEETQASPVDLMEALRASVAVTQRKPAGRAATKSRAKTETKPKPRTRATAKKKAKVS